MSKEADATIVSSNSFGCIHVLEPNSQHTHTAILLHGRGSTGEEFSEELFDTKLSGSITLADKLPGWRWVFPSSRELWSTAFEEEMPAWFEAHSLTDITARQDLQPAGIRESVRYLEGILNEEVQRLGGKAEKVVLGGVSQGGAIGLWTLLCPSNAERRLGAFIGASTWLPFATNIDAFLGKDAVSSRDDGKAETDSNEGDAFVADMMTQTKSSLAHRGPFLFTPVFLGHGIDDAYVDIELGQQARHVLTQIGLTVEWKEYSGAEQEGHWLKAPEEVDDIARFLSTHVANL
ncbi:hypothetical protein QQX98_010009 [Neonectria punicea]|uniref:Phospholipase/carboxylesterase/thioesterase domain-containing protein n=1 Tax=Neonectria punicea TaxID=979145 RepID=A0ABR1GQP1_9HYPO